MQKFETIPLICPLYKNKSQTNEGYKFKTRKYRTIRRKQGWTFQDIARGSKYLINTPKS